MPRLPRSQRRRESREGDPSVEELFAGHSEEQDSEEEEPEEEQAAGAEEEEAEPDPRDKELADARERERRERERTDDLIRRLTATPKQSQTEAPPAPLIPDDFPDPIQEPEKFRAALREAGGAVVERATQQAQRLAAESEQRRRAEEVVRDFLAANPWAKDLGSDYIHQQFVKAQTARPESDVETLSRDVLDRLSPLKAKLASEEDEEEPAGEEARNGRRSGAIRGTSGGTRGRRVKKKATVDEDSPSSMVDQILTFQDRAGL